MENRSFLNRIRAFSKVLIFAIGLASLLFYLAVVNLFTFTLMEKIIVILGLLVIYVILSILIVRARRYLMFMGSKKKQIVKTVKVPVVKEVIVEKAVDKKAKKWKFYGSTESNTYHTQACRFSGMIKPKYLVTKDDNDYFRKKKFKACKNCKPGKKK